MNFKVLLKMKSTEYYLAEIKEIRKMMEESSRFLSLSGLSGILIGIYALIGAFIANSILYTNHLLGWLLDENIVHDLLLLAAIVLGLSLLTVVLAALIPSLDLLFWAVGFGVVHIIYGTVMYLKYEHKTNA